MFERSSLRPFPHADNSLMSSGTHWRLKWACSAENKLHNSRDLCSASLVLWMNVLWRQMSSDAGTREAIGAEVVRAGAGVEWHLGSSLLLQRLSFPCCCALNHLFSLGSLTLIHFSTVWLTSLHWDMVFYSIFPLLFYSFVFRLSAWN